MEIAVGIDYHPACRTASVTAKIMEALLSSRPPHFVLPYAQVQSAIEQQTAIDMVAPPDSLTVGAIGILAYMFGSVLHEGVGHGGACLLVGAKPLALSSVYFECSL